MPDEHTDHTHHVNVPLRIIAVIAASTVGIIVGTGVGGLIGYKVQLGLLGLFAPIVLGIAIQLGKVYEVKNVE